jgi:tRNA pseudouridine38-40 synthase
MRLTGASRTDAGVHARGQVVTLRTTRTIPLEGVRRGLNSDAAAEHRGARGQRSRPRVPSRASRPPASTTATSCGWRERAPLVARTAWHVYAALAMAPMHRAGRHPAGEHDFSAFRAVGCTAMTTVRRLDRHRPVALSNRASGPARREGNAFLRNMVRIMAGTLVRSAWGACRPRRVAEILASRPGQRAGQTAPAHGLVLIAVCLRGVRRAPTAVEPPPL